MNTYNVYILSDFQGITSGRNLNKNINCFCKITSFLEWSISHNNLFVQEPRLFICITK